jgi:hypothetical protein
MRNTRQITHEQLQIGMVRRMFNQVEWGRFEPSLCSFSSKFKDVHRSDDLRCRQPCMPFRFYRGSGGKTVWRQPRRVVSAWALRRYERSEL